MLYEPPKRYQEMHNIESQALKEAVPIQKLIIYKLDIHNQLVFDHITKQPVCFYLYTNCQKNKKTINRTIMARKYDNWIGIKLEENVPITELQTFINAALRQALP